MVLNGITPLDLRAVPFARRPILCHGSQGSPYTRWVPYGMPQLGRYRWMLDFVFFLYESKADALAGKNTGGTGFLVSVPSIRWPTQIHHQHAVTNWHVATQGAPVIRINTVSGPPEVFEFGPEEWIFKPKPVLNDVVVSPPLALIRNTHKAESILLSSLLTTAKEKELDINAADDVFMVGRFVDYDGIEVNAPSFRFGHISILSAMIKQPTGAVARSIVVDMHSRTGYSGSPVFVYRTAGSFFFEGGKGQLVGAGHTMELLGIHWGQFPELWELKDKEKLTGAKKSTALITDGKYVDGLSGMTCVVPAQVIRDVLELPELAAMREEEEQKILREIGENPLGPKAESAGSSVGATTTANPNHREDFMRLLGEAARKREQED
jgi:hypothetical protein